MGDYYDQDGNPIDLLTWAQLLTGDRHVAATAIDDNVWVSTVYLGVDHNFGLKGPPLIFETMVFGGPLDEWAWRHPNREAAIAGHDQAVAQARDAARQARRS